MPVRSRHNLPGQGVKIGDLIPALGSIRYADMGLWHGPGREHSNFRDYTYQAKFESTTHLSCMLENMRDSLLWDLGRSVRISGTLCIVRRNARFVSHPR